MTGADEEWVRAAMIDDKLVVELLVRLNRSTPQSQRVLLKPAVLPLEWSVRQRRSKPVSVSNPKKPGHRASPTAPLSWSGATSISGGSGGSGGGGGGCEESSRPALSKLFNTTRSKVNGNSEKAASKRSRKKKNLAELKEEETLLIKERRELKREIAALRLNLEKQRSKNESWKRMKLELPPFQERELTSIPEEAVSCQLQPTVATCHPVPPTTPHIVTRNNVTLQSSSSNGFPELISDAATDSKFILPDLNIPFDQVPSSVDNCGVSSRPSSINW